MPFGNEATRSLSFFQHRYAGRITFEFAEQWNPLVIADDVNVHFFL